MSASGVQYERADASINRLAIRTEAVGLSLAKRSRISGSSTKVSESCLYTQGCTCPVVAYQPMVLVMCTSICCTPS